MSSNTPSGSFFPTTRVLSGSPDPLADLCDAVMYGVASKVAGRVTDTGVATDIMRGQVKAAILGDVLRMRRGPLVTALDLLLLAGIVAALCAWCDFAEWLITVAGCAIRRLTTR